MQHRAFPIVLVFAGLLSSFYTLSAADVSHYWISKSQGWEQTGPDVVARSGGDKYSFNARYVESSTGAVASGGISPPWGAELPFSAHDSYSGIFWTCDEDIGIPAFNAQFPNGDYQFRFVTLHDGTKTPTLTLTGDNYPALSRLTNFAAAQHIDATSNFTLHWSPFEQGRVLDYIYVEINTSFTNAIGTNVFKTGLPGASNSLNGLSNSMVIPAGILMPGTSYRAYFWFARVTDYDTTSYSGAKGYAGYGQNLYFDMKTADPVKAPTIVVQPQSQTVPVGTNAVFSVSANGSLPLSYQWRFNGTPINGATATDYTIYSSQPANCGNYTVVITNTYGFATSEVATLTATNSSPPYTYTTNSGKITITKYIGGGGVVEIPTTVTGLPVTSIGGGAFYRCTGLTSITIPSSVTRIGANVFGGCSNLTSVTIPSSVTNIGSYMFSGCTSLTSLMIPSSVTSIGDGTFYGCTGLTSATIPSSVTSIGNSAFETCSSLTSVAIPSSVTRIGAGAFWGCSSLTAITVGALSPSYSCVDGVMFDRSQTTLIQCPGGKLGSYIAPTSVTNIGDGAFYGCTGLTSVTIPSNVAIIGNSAFFSCVGLTNMTIPSSVTSIGSYVFSYCYGLTSVTLPNGLTSIGDRGFRGCRSLTTVTIPSRVTRLERDMFLGCTSLASITIPSSVTNIGDGAFWGCTSLTSFAVPSSVTIIGYYAFFSCISLTNVAIPSSVISTGAGAFWGCSSLTAITVGALSPSYSCVDGVMFDRSQTTLIQCPGGKLGSYIVPTSVTNIGDGAFYGCTGLTSVTIPSSVTSIGPYVFYGCTGLTSVTIPNSVTLIGSYAFWGCASLMSVTIPSGVTNIGDGAFFSCTNLSSVTIPSSIISMVVQDLGQFENCANLKGVYFNGNAPFVDPRVFYGVTNATVYYLSRTTGWRATFEGLPTAPWKPLMQVSGSSFCLQTNGFGVNITWASGSVIVVEVCTNLAKPLWVPVVTNTLSSGSSYFNDPHWTNSGVRFFRVRSP